MVFIINSELSFLSNRGNSWIHICFRYHSASVQSQARSCESIGATFVMEPPFHFQFWCCHTRQSKFACGYSAYLQYTLSMHGWRVNWISFLEKRTCSSETGINYLRRKMTLVLDVKHFIMVNAEKKVDLENKNENIRKKMFQYYWT